MISLKICRKQDPHRRRQPPAGATRCNLVPCSAEQHLPCPFLSPQTVISCDVEKGTVRAICNNTATIGRGCILQGPRSLAADAAFPPTHLEAPPQGAQELQPPGRHCRPPNNHGEGPGRSPELGDSEPGRFHRWGHTSTPRQLTQTAALLLTSPGPSMRVPGAPSDHGAPIIPHSSSSLHRRPRSGVLRAEGVRHNRDPQGPRREGRGHPHHREDRKSGGAGQLRRHPRARRRSDGAPAGPACCASFPAQAR